MVTQTPDYIMPLSSCLLQERLGLSKDCAAFDLGLGSRYVYGLWLASMMLDSGGLRPILLLHGKPPPATRPMPTGRWRCCSATQARRQLSRREGPMQRSVGISHFTRMVPGRAIRSSRRLVASGIGHLPLSATIM